MAPRTPLIHPAAYFENTSHNPYTAGLLIFVGYVIATSAATVSLISVLGSRVQNAPPEFEQAMSGMIGPTIILLIIVSIVSLFVVASIMHHLTNGDGAFGEAIAVAGWAYAPNLLSIPISYVYAKRQLNDLVLDGSSPEMLQQQLETAQLGGSSVVSMIIMLAVILWSVYILAYGTAATHDADVDSALGAAAIVGIGAFFMGII